MSWNEDSLHRWLAEQAWPEGLVDHVAMTPRSSSPSTAGWRSALTSASRKSTSTPASSWRSPEGKLSCAASLGPCGHPRASDRGDLDPQRRRHVARERALRSLLQGARAAAAEHGAELVAGDLASAPGALVISVSAIGRVAGGDLLLAATGRGQARGSTSQARWAERISWPSSRDPASLRPDRIGGRGDRHDGRQRRPRMGSASPATGLGVWRPHRVGRTPRPPRRPRRRVGDATAALEAALHDGEDHELIATSEVALPDPCGIRVGAVEAGEGLVLASASGRAKRLEGRWQPSATRGGPMVSRTLERFRPPRALGRDKVSRWPWT